MVITVDYCQCENDGACISTAPDILDPVNFKCECKRENNKAPKYKGKQCETCKFKY